MKGYKGFDGNFRCQDFQFEVGKTYEYSGNIELCESGFHFCESPLAVFSYYFLDARFAEIEAEDVSEKRDMDGKRVCKKITIIRELTLAELIHADVKWTQTHSGVAGTKGQSSVAGDRGIASVAGTEGIAGVAGDCGKSSVAGDCGKSSVVGDYGQSSVVGHYGKSSVVGMEGQSSVAGDRGQSGVAGDCGKSSVVGMEGQSSVAGNYGIASVIGEDGMAKAGPNGLLILTWWDQVRKRYHVVTGEVGVEGIEADTWYCVQDNKLSKVK
ncbi:MAG: hypothetical protein QME66_10455 [Candidatus Eisenbacteria bacterium]|nr:hypothetical protein [Candidatus Eisenbacteria bacterium]